MLTNAQVAVEAAARLGAAGVGELLDNAATIADWLDAREREQAKAVRAHNERVTKDMMQGRGPGRGI